MRRAIVAALLVAAACSNKPAAPPIPTAPAGGALVAFRQRHVVAVEIAASPADWQKGLMNRTSMDKDAGMIFLFPAPTKTGFWMKNTLIPLSIAFLKRKQGQTYTVARVLDMEPCKKDPCPLYDPKVAYDAALEVNKGWFRLHNVHEGTEGRLGRATTQK